MDYYEAVAAQPARLESSAAAVSAALASMDLNPWRPGLLAIVSMGASSHAAQALVQRLARHGRRVIAVDASEVLTLEGAAGTEGSVDLADSYLYISEGGRSRETIEAARARGSKPALVLTNVPDAPISQVVDQVIGLAHGDDSAVYTVGYVSSLQAMGLLARALDGVDEGEDWASLPALVATTLAGLAEGPDVAAIAEVLDRSSSIDFVGSGASRGSASEAALLFRESARIPTAAYETYQYLHGPMECLTERQAVMVFGEAREVELARYLAAADVPTVLVTSAPASVVAPTGNLWVQRIAAAAPLPRSVLQILPPQLIAGELARRRGLRIDGFRYHQDDTKVGQPAAAQAGVG